MDAERSALIAGHKNYAASLARRYSSKLTCHVETDDLVSEALYALCTAGMSFRAERGASFTSWVSLRIMWRMYDYLTRKDMQPKHRMSFEALDPELESVWLGISPQISDTNILLDQGIRRLDTRLRRIIRMLYFDGLTSEMASKKLGISQSYLHQLERRALARLRDWLE